VKLTTAQNFAVLALEDSDGRISPRRLIKAAKHKTSPLHALFDWNVQRAAERYWLQRAREIIGSVTVQVTTEERVIKTPCYVRDLSVQESGYQRVDRIGLDPAASREVLIYTLEVASGHLRRAYDLAQPLGLAPEIDGLVERITGLTRSLRSAAA